MEELKPVHCGCGGEAEVYPQPLLGCYVICGNCGMRTRLFINRAEAIEAWNRAMGATDICVGDNERTAKVTTIEKLIEGSDSTISVSACSQCLGVVSVFDTYCSGCGARLEWK